MIKALILAFFCFGTFLIVHFSLFYFRSTEEKTRSVLNTFLGSCLFYCFLQIALPSEARFRSFFGAFAWFVQVEEFLPSAVGLLFLAFLFLGYLEFFFTADRSITCRMMMLIARAPKRSMTETEMQAIYDAPEILRERFRDLVYGGYLLKQGDNYSLSKRGEKTMRLYRFVIRFLHLNTSFQRTVTKECEIILSK